MFVKKYTQTYAVTSSRETNEEVDSPLTHFFASVVFCSNQQACVQITQGTELDHFIFHLFSLSFV